MLADWFSDRRLRLLGIAVLIVITAVPYLSSLRNDFVEWDDYALIVNNPVVQELSAASIRHAFTSYDPELYVPLTTLSYQINHLIGGLDPFVYHLTNLLLHIANVLLVTLIMMQLGIRGRTALIVGGLFALHPLQAEAVAWASARKDLLSAFFALASTAAYLRYRRNASRGWYGSGIALFFCGLLSKVSVAPLPLVFLCIDWYQERRIDKKAMLEKLPHALLSIVFIIIAMAGKETGSLFLWEKFLLGCKAILFYILKFFVPTDLSVLYPYTAPLSLFTPDLFVSVMLTLAITIIVLMLFHVRRMRAPLFAWAWYLLFLLPTFNNAARGHNELLDLYFASDRYVYLSLVAILFLIALCIEKWIDRYPAVIAGIALVTAVTFGALTYNQARVWNTTFSLFWHATEARPDSYVAHSNVGTQLYKQGKIDEALAEYALALKIRSDATTWFNAGQILILQDKKENAMAAFRQAIEASPLEIDAHLQLARLHLERGERDEAIRILEAAKEIAPERADVQELLLYIQAGSSL